MSLPRVEAHARTDFSFFTEYVLGYTLKDYHRRAIQMLWDDKGKTTPFLCYKWARGHGKSALFSQALPIWRMYKSPTRFLANLTSSSETQSKRVLEETKIMIEGNEMLNSLIPAFDRSTIWNRTEIKTSNQSTYTVKNFTGTSIRGSHVDLYICDDILRDDGKTQEQIKELFWSCIYPTVQQRNGQLIVVGTPITSDDLLADLTGYDDEGKKLYPDVKSMICPACRMDNEGKITNIIWPESFDKEKLMRIRNQQGALIFTREYLCNPVGGGANFFSYDILKRQTHKLRLNVARKNCTYYGALDVALSKDKRADYAVITVLEKDPLGIIRQVRCDRLPKGTSVDRQLQIVREYHTIFNFNTFLIEKRGLSVGMANDAMIDPRMKSYVKDFVTHRNNKHDIITRMLHGMQSGMFFILDNPNIIEEFSGIILKQNPTTLEETFESVAKHDDIVMSSGMAYYAANSPGGVASVSVV